MNKQEILQGIASLSQTGELTREEVLQAVASKTQGDHQMSRLAEVMYYIGGIIVCIGIAVLVGQNWEDLPSFARILSTFGAAVAAYVVAALLSSRPQSEKVARAFWLIAGVTLPLGLNVTFYEAGQELSIPETQSVIFALLTATFLLSTLLFKRVVLLFFTILFGTGLYYVFTSYLTSNIPIFVEPEFSEYRTLLVGLVLSLLGYHFNTTSMKELANTLYSFGSMAFLGAALALGGYSPDANMFWEVVFPALALLVIFGSVQLKNKPFLVVGSLFLIGYIAKITPEYFSDSLGWPLALVIAGLLIIGIGYASLRLNQRYLKQTPAV